MTAHSLSLRAYGNVFATLLALTGATTALAYIDLGVFNPIVALSIAAAKALLVALFFMHLVHTKHRTQLVAGAGILWLLILITLTLSDVLTRQWFPQPTGWSVSNADASARSTAISRGAAPLTPASAPLSCQAVSGAYLLRRSPRAATCLQRD